MNLGIKYIRHFLFLVLFVIYAQPYVFSQGTNINRGNKTGIFIGLDLEPSQSQILNEESISGSKLTSGKLISYSGAIEVGYFFSNYFGLSSGIGMNSYKTQLNLDSYQSKFNTTDSENESYERRVSGTGIKENQNISAISIPICINLRLPFNETTGLFLQTGLNMSVPMGKSYSSNGTFTYKGYYPADNVLLESLPDYGFPSNVRSNTDGKLKLKSFGTDVMASAGFDFLINEKIEIAVAACYNKSLSNISGYSSPDSFQLTSDPGQINSFMGGTTKATSSSIGLRIAFRYYLK
jgi:hypothetical protein